MPTRLLRLTRASRDTPAGFLSNNPVDADTADLLRRWRSDSVGRNANTLDFASTYAVVLIHWDPSDLRARDQLREQFELLGIEALDVDA